VFVNQSTEPEWKLASLLADEQKLFVLWNVRGRLCRNLADFQKHYGPGFPTGDMMDELKRDGFLSTAASEFELTGNGLRALKYLDDSKPDSVPRDETDAVAELRKIRSDISGAGVTRDLNIALRIRAENIYTIFSYSSAVKDLYYKIKIAAQPVPVPEPDSCRVLRENLSGTPTARTIIAALEKSGFYRNADLSSLELDCFRNAIHGALQTLRASYEMIEGLSLDKVQSKLDSLREVLEALPPHIEAPRRAVEKIIYQLEIKSAHDRFISWLERLRKRVDEQDFTSNLDRSELQLNQWVQENPTAPEVVEAQKHFALLEQLRRAFQTQTEDAALVRDLIDLQDYDQALNEVRLTDARLRETGLRNREPLDSEVDHLVDKLEEVYQAQELSAFNVTLTEAKLQASLSDLGRLGVQLQKVPETHKVRTDHLHHKAETLSEELATRLNKLRSQAAREGLRNIPVERVPAYIAELRISLPALGEWTRKVELVLEALERVRGSGPVDSIYLARLENAEENLGASLLTQAAKKAVQEWRDAAALDYLYKSDELVQALQEIALDHLNSNKLGEAISAVVERIDQYRRYQESNLFAEAQRKFAEQYKSLDQRVLRFRQAVIPEAIRRWAKLIASDSASQADINAARQSLVAWHDVLGVDFPQPETDRVLDERSAEMEIQALIAAGKFDEAIKVIHNTGRLLSPGFIVEHTRMLGRRKAVAHYETGQEAAIAEAIKEHGPDSQLLKIVVEDFATKGQIDHLAAIHVCLEQIEAIDRHAARLVRWVFDFKSGVLEDLAQSLATSEETESVLIFAKGLANGIHHAHALRVLQLAFKETRSWPAEIRADVKASYEILSVRFTDAVSRIEVALQDLIERGKSAEQTVVAETRNDALLQQEIEAAFARAQAFLNASLASIEDWLSYLTSATHFEVEFDPSLRTRIQDEDLKLRTNAQLLERLTTARRAIEKYGWMKLEDLRKALTLLIVPVSSVAAVVKLLNRYLENYRPTTELVGELTEAWKKGGAGMSSAQLTNIVNRLTLELKYDFRSGQDRFQQLQRLSGRTFQEFVEELRVMLAEVEAVNFYQERLLSAMTGKGDLLRLRMQNGLEQDRQAVFELLSQKDSLGKSILDWYQKPPETSHSPVATERLRLLQNSDWFQLLRKAVSFTAELSKRESTQDLIPDV
jgi:hypothetical protein